MLKIIVQNTAIGFVLCRFPL